MTLGPGLGPVCGLMWGLGCMPGSATPLFDPAPAPAVAPTVPVEAEAKPAPPAEAYVRASPRCGEHVAHCFGIFVHVVYRDEVPAGQPRWLADRVRQANRLFSAIDVGFEVVRAERLDGEHWRIATRLQRDELGAERFAPGLVHLFLVGQLDDVDVADTQIRGVHWRLRRDVSRRWVIMSSISGEMVLAHELGHFFSLPHSSYRVSVMNKKPREAPPWSERVFADPEVDKMRAARDEMLRDGMLEPRPRE